MELRRRTLMAKYSFSSKGLQEEILFAFTFMTAAHDCLVNVLYTC